MSWETRLDSATKEALPELRMAAEEPMSRHTSFRIGGPARRMAFPGSGAELVRLWELARECGARPAVIGNGTNLLVPDAGVDRLVINTSAGMRRIEPGEDGGAVIVAEAGASLRRVAEFACERGLAGLEFAHGIPGSLGGAVCMNAGAYGGEMAQVLTGAEILFPDDGVRFLPVEDLRLGYRHSLLTEMPDAVVLRAALRLQPGDREAIRTRMRDLMERRKQSQPLDFPSAGSTFKRPAGGFAGTLIDQCGLKGFRTGGAQVSEKHAGFIINTGGATFADVAALMEAVRRRVLEEKGVTLEPEIRILDSV